LDAPFAAFGKSGEIRDEQVMSLHVEVDVFP
jgi:hypothetical protein